MRPSVVTLFVVAAFALACGGDTSTEGTTTISTEGVASGAAQCCQITISGNIGRLQDDGGCADGRELITGPECEQVCCVGPKDWDDPTMEYELMLRATCDGWDGKDSKPASDCDGHPQRNPATKGKTNTDMVTEGLSSDIPTDPMCYAYQNDGTEWHATFDAKCGDYLTCKKVYGTHCFKQCAKQLDGTYAFTPSGEINAYDGRYTYEQDESKCENAGKTTAKKPAASQGGRTMTRPGTTNSRPGTMTRPGTNTRPGTTTRPSGNSGTMTRPKR